MAEITKPVKVGNVWTNLISNKTGESVNYEEVTTWLDGTPMDDSKCDGTIYRKLPSSLGGGYVKRKYTGPANVKWFGAKGDGITDDKAAFNLALQLCSEVLVPEGTYVINVTESTASGGINMQSNTHLIMEEGAVITCQPNNFTHYAIIGVANKTNVRITGGTIVGDKYTHTGSTGERGMGIWIHKGSKIQIDGVRVEKCWGDGIYLGTDQSTSGNDSPTDVTITNVVCDDNRRQGISVVAAKNLFILNSRFTNTDGTPPQAGIDIEPNQYQTVEGVTIDSCYFEGNTGSGVEVAAYYTDSYIKGVYVANSTFIDNVILLTTDDGGDGLLSDVTILSNIFQIATRDRAIRINYNPSNVVIDACKMVATSQGDGAANGIIIEGATGPVTITNCHINDFPSSGIRLLGSSGVNIVNNDIQGHIRAIYSTGTSSNITIENNRLTGGSNSALTFTDSYSHIFVTANVVLNSSITPIQFSTAAENCVIANNKIVGFSGTSGNYPAISLGGTSTLNTVYGNTVVSPTGRFTSLVFLGGSTTNNRVYDNSYSGTFATAEVVNNGTDNLIFPYLQFEQGGQLSVNGQSAINISSLSIPNRSNATNAATSALFQAYFNTTGSSGYPATTGGGFRIQRNASNLMGSIEFWKDNTNGDDIYVRGGTQPFKRLIKEGDVSASADSASAPGVTYDQAEVQAILDELRDLKTKMRAAGLLAT